MRRHLHKLLDDLETDQVEVCLPKKLTREYLAAHTPAGIAEAEWTEFARYLVSRVVIATLKTLSRVAVTVHTVLPNIPSGRVRERVPRRYMPIF